MSRGRYSWGTFGREVTLLLVTLAFCLPLYILVNISLKTTNEAYVSAIKLPNSLQWGNYSKAWHGTGGLSMGQAFANSLIITIGSVLCLILLGSVCAYALGRRRSILSTSLYFFFVIGVTVPYQLAVLPLYVGLREIGLLGSYVGMIALYTGLLLPLTILMYTGFVRVLPRDYEEAAQVDGSGLVRTFLLVVFPLLRPVTGTVAVLTSLIIWNDFFIPLIYLSGSDHAPLPVLVFSLASQNAAEWDVIFAAVVIAILPMVAFFLVAQRQLLRGFTGGVKG